MDWYWPDAPQVFKKFKAQCQLYFSVPLNDKWKEEKVNYLRRWLGNDCWPFYSCWCTESWPNFYESRKFSQWALWPPLLVWVDVVVVRMIFLSYFLPSLWTNLRCTWKSEPLEKVCHALSLPKGKQMQRIAIPSNPKHQKGNLAIHDT